MAAEDAKDRLDREGKALVTKAVYMALGDRELFNQFQEAVTASGLPLEACVTKAVKLFVDEHEQK